MPDLLRTPCMTHATRPQPSRSAILLVLGIVVACGAPDDGARTGVATAVESVDGVTHVRNSGMPEPWVATRVLRLGAVTGGPEEFGRVRSVIADADGNVYVADNMAHEVRVFDADGNHLRTIGRRGGGPGEFGDLYSLAWLQGRLAAMDPANARIALLTPHGEWSDGLRHYPMTGPPSFIRLHPLGDDGFYTPVIAPGSPRPPFVRYTAGGAADTIAMPLPPANMPQTGVLCHRPDGGITAISVPEAPAVVYAFPPAGGQVAVAWTEHYRVAILTAAGDTVRTVTREQPAVPYGDSLWLAAQEPYRELRANFPGARCEPATLSRPQHRAAIRFLTYDEDGRLWVEAAAPADGFVWDVFDGDGRLVGSAPAPPRAASLPPYIRNGRLYQVETDELGVQYVAVYRVAPVRQQATR